MQNLLQELELIEALNKEFFEKKNIKLYQYITITKCPVMIRFNSKMDNIFNLPKEIFDKVNSLILSYYGM